MASGSYEEKNYQLLFDIDGTQLRDTPSGQIYLKKNCLFFEFFGRKEPIKISSSRIPKTVVFYEDRIYLPHPENKQNTLVLIPDLKDSDRRFLFQSLRSWVLQLGGKSFAKIAPPILRFYNFPCKIFILLQLALPFLLYYAFFAFIHFGQNETRLITDFYEFWQQIVFSPLIAIHYVLFGLFAFFALIFSHRWALICLMIGSFLMVFGVTIASILVPGNFYLAVIPYTVCLSFFAFYDIYCINIP